MKSNWNEILSAELTIFKNKKGGKVTNKAKLVNIFDPSSLKIFLYLKKDPKKIIAKKGIVIDNTVCIVIKS